MVSQTVIAGPIPRWGVAAVLCLLGLVAAADPLDEAQALLHAQRERPDLAGFERAVALLDAALAARPTDARGWTLRAWAHMTEHRFAEALDAARMALAQDAEQPAALAVQTDALIELGRYPEAIASAQRLLDLDPGLPAWVRAARLRWLHGDPDGAVALLTQAAEAAGPRGEAVAWVRLELARLALDAGDLAAATAAVEAAGSALPTHPRLPGTRARLLDLAGDPAGALAAYQEALITAPNAEDALAAWRLARRLGDNGAARTLATLLDGLGRLDTGGRDARALAEFWCEAGDPIRAMALADAELARRPDVFSHATRARALAAAGRTDEARAEARRALALGTPDPALRRGLAALVGDAPVGAVAAADGRLPAASGAAR